VDTATGLKYPWFDRGCTYHYCGHILASIAFLGAGAENDNPQNLDFGHSENDHFSPKHLKGHSCPTVDASCPSFAPITCQYNPITSEANQSWTTAYHRSQRNPIPQTQKVTMDVQAKLVSLF
jgi:hypothetical protein